MTVAPYTAEERALANTLAPWVSRADRQVQRRVSDARSHAEGRSTGDAPARLEELQVWLANHIGDARVRFYRDAFRWHAKHMDPAIRWDAAVPSPDGDVVARTAKVGGRDAYADLGRVIAVAKLGLATATSAASDPHVQPNLRGSILASWEVTHREAIQRFARITLSDSQISLWNVVAQVMVQPELR